MDLTSALIAGFLPNFHSSTRSYIESGSRNAKLKHGMMWMTATMIVKQNQFVKYEQKNHLQINQRQQAQRPPKKTDWIWDMEWLKIFG